MKLSLHAILRYGKIAMSDPSFVTITCSRGSVVCKDYRSDGHDPLS